ncbi:MAG: hydroxyacylglutathione hydrolase [Hydrogenovibrio sp.]
MKIVGLPTLSDNYTWVLLDDNPEHHQAWVVDPGQAKPVIDYLHAHRKTLAGILLTHHHWDHTNGISELRHQYGDVSIVSQAQGPFKPVTFPVTEGDEIRIHDKTFTVLATPGHTHEHLSFYHPEILFCGDVLFTGGCGKTWTQPASVMAQSLLKLRDLPDDCAVYCGHEYTYANLNFARIAEPDNPEIAERLAQVKLATQKGNPCVPAPLGLEKRTNPFLRFDRSPLKHILIARSGQPTLSDAEAYAHLRAWKDTLDATGTLEAGLYD